MAASERVLLGNFQVPSNLHDKLSKGTVNMCPSLDRWDVYVKISENLQKTGMFVLKCNNNFSFIYSS